MAKRFKKVYIEISNVCNLQCSFCPEVSRDKTFMEPALFERAVTAVAPLTDEVCFHLMGEPLLHPRFDEYVRFCESLAVRINLTTNGLLLDERRSDTLLNPALRQVNFSLQSFQANFPERDPSGYLQKIFKWTQWALAERPDIYINYRLWNHGATGADAANDTMIETMRQEFGADFSAFADVRWKKSAKIKGRLYLHFDSRFVWPNSAHPVRSTRGFCHGLSSHIGILADGTVVPCCLDKEGVISLGNCHTQTIDQILESQRAQDVRNGFQKGMLVEDLCQKCTFITRFDKRIPSMVSGVVPQPALRR